MSDAQGDQPTPRLRRWIKRIPADDVLFHEGDTDRRVFVLIDGRVAPMTTEQPVDEVVARSEVG